jgi:HlyD family secretion protein
LKKALLVALVAAVGVVAWGVFRKHTPPEVKFARVQRTTLVSTLPTNGKVEPFEWQPVRAETAGVVRSVPVHEGSAVARGAILAEISDPRTQAEIEAGEARVAEARAALSGLEAGGPPAELADIENNLSAARFSIEQNQRDAASLERLVKAHAATPAELEGTRTKILQAQMQMEALERRRKSLVGKSDVEGARARLQDAEAALRLARQRAAQNAIHSPISGSVYGLAIRPGAYLNAGDLVANVGQLSRLRVRVYVDEPELGRVAEGQPVTITWDALPGQKWDGTVAQRPTAIQPLGTRQVGEVMCVIDNPGRELIPGTNVNAEIRTAVVPNAFVIPKEAIRRDAQGVFVLVLSDGALERRSVTTAHSSITTVEVAGLAEGVSVALPGETPLQPGMKVTPIY